MLYGLWELFFGNYWQVQLEPTTSLALLRRDFYAASKYTGIVQASRDIFREEGLPVLIIPSVVLFSLAMQMFLAILVTSIYRSVTSITLPEQCTYVLYHLKGKLIVLHSSLKSSKELQGKEQALFFDAHECQVVRCYHCLLKKKSSKYFQQQQKKKLQIPL